jgi:hypothetical protein
MDSIEWGRISGLSNVWVSNVPNMRADICSYRDLISGQLGSDRMGTQLEELLRKPLRLYKHFFFVNCGVRGPFFHLDFGSPTPRAEQWLKSFTDRLSSSVLLVGPTVSCQLDTPHVQSYAVAMTQATYKWFAKDAWGNCSNKTKDDIIVDSEVGLSAKISNAGFGLGSLMGRHRDLTKEWMTRRDVCPDANPTMEPLDPHEIHFIKFGGQIFHTSTGHNLIHPKTVQQVEDATKESGELLDLHLRLRNGEKPAMQSKCRAEPSARHSELSWWQSFLDTVFGEPQPQHRQDGLPTVPWRTTRTHSHSHARPLEVAVILRVALKGAPPTEGAFEPHLKCSTNHM